MARCLGPLQAERRKALARQPKGIGRRANNIAQYLTKAGIEYKSKRTKIGAVTTLKKASSRFSYGLAKGTQ